MELKNILERLCYYNKNNPDRGLDEPQETPKNCHCDNCYYGRTELAEEILRLRKLLENDK